ncbi:EAL domain-containing protein [Alteromonas sp. H39]|uniref:EAL domain-containing protein n=1 Tax=Alteromonas sp. H39 TaxID=3389876 RepID=UPI0039DF97B4
MDDFGTGFSSLSYLRNLPITNLKIDKSFVDNIIESQEAATLCGGIISLAKSLNLHIVAEGVETESQSIVLKALRCDSFQGYFFHKPQPVGKIEQLFPTKE